MYGPELTTFLRSLATVAQRAEIPYSLLDASLAAYLQAFADRTRGESEPHVSFSELTTRLVMLSDLLARQRGNSPELHYLVAMCFEQAGFMSATQRSTPAALLPFDDDDFLRLVLANLHYLAGEYRAHAAASLERLSMLAAGAQPYVQVVSSLRRLLRRGVDEHGLAQGSLGGTDRTREHVSRLLGAITHRRGGIAEQLGSGSPAWLAERGVTNESAPPLWQRFVANLEAAGISSLTHEQYGSGDWISTNKDVLVDFPTGSGKTVIGYVRTALCVSARASALWILPTRALVRQVLRGLRRMFREMDVQVQEVPTTEDPGALFSDAWQLERPIVAATTPERALALLRANPVALQSVGVVVLDEAHILCDEDRGVVAEQLVGGLKAQTANQRFVMMTGFSEAVPVLRSISQALQLDLTELRSAVRPSRRVYGILRSTGAALETAVYPPRASGDTQDGAPAFVVRYPDREHRKPRLASNTARLFAARTHQAGLRAVVFVRTKESTEAQAERIGAATSYRIPDDVRVRLAMELGRASILEQTVHRGAAPHHGGLSSLEQNVIERLVALGQVTTVFATPTLAQGVNLPLDLSIVTFTDRRDAETESNDDLPESEVQNMLGRAGRAGLVPDGFCVLVRKESPYPREFVLANNRRWFFAQRQPNAAGVVALLRRVASVAAISQDWLDTLSGVEFSEAQSILAMLAATVAAGNELSDLERFPSVRALSARERAELLYAAEAIAVRLRQIGERSPQSLQLVARTGLPPAFAEHVLARVREDALLARNADWWDATIDSFLSTNAAVPWVKNLCGDVAPAGLVAFATVWRSGVPRSQLETLWTRRTRARLVRINTGSYLNQRMSLVAQLWGVAASVAEILDLEAPGLRQLGACVREGVPTNDALIWLRALGSLDRVLATKIDQYMTLDEGPYHHRIQSATAALRNMIESPPIDSDPTILGAVRSALGDEQ